MIKKTTSGIVASFALTLALVALPALADTISGITFESPDYSVGNINGQQGWSKTGPFDSVVDTVASFANAASFGFGAQSLRISNAVTSGSFGDQTFSPGLSDVAGESEANQYFEASFEIGSTQASQQPGLFLSVSPDDGQGSRMSYAGFDDQADGIHVIFYDVTNPGPLGTVASFNGTDVATIDRTSAHTVKFVIDFVPGPANDVVKLYIDGDLKITGTTWEDYYRYDPEQNGNGNVVPTTSKLLFRAGGTAVPATLGNGYLIDNVNLASVAPVVDYKGLLKEIASLAKQAKKDKLIKGYDQANITRPVTHALNAIKNYEKRLAKGREDSAREWLGNYYGELNELERAINHLPNSPELSSVVAQMLDYLEQVRNASPQL